METFYDERFCEIAFSELIKSDLLEIERALDSNLGRLAGPLEARKCAKQSILQDCMFAIRERVHDVVAYCLVDDLHTPSIRAALPGRTGRERFFAYVRDLQEEGSRRRIESRFSGITKDAQSVAYAACKSFMKMFERLERDFQTITESPTLGPLPDDGLSYMHGNLGDPHRGGESPILLGFRSGATLLYKPRSVFGEYLFDQLVEHLRNAKPFDGLAACAVLERRGYGWMEDAGRDGSVGEGEARKFFYHAGLVACLLTLLRARDMHCSNVRVSNSIPIPIDLETVLQPDLGSILKVPRRSAIRVFERRSVVGTGFIPMAYDLRYPGRYNGMAGLSAVWSGLEQYPLNKFVDTCTDRMRVARVWAKPPTEYNLPICHGKPVLLCDYYQPFRQGLLDGFKALRDSAILPPPESLLPSNSDASWVRVVLRPTRIYCDILKALRHPVYRCDRSRRNLLYEKLCSAFEECGLKRTAVLSEIADLDRSDIPYFYYKLSDGRIRDSSGKVIDSSVSIDWLQILSEGFASPHPETLKKQMWFLDATLYGKRELTVPDGEEIGGAMEQNTNSECVRADAKLTAAKIARQIWGIRCVNGMNIRWPEAIEIEQNRSNIQDAGASLYSGTAGICLFLCRYAAIDNCEEMQEMADSAKRQLAHTALFMAEKEHRIGALIGKSGVLYCMSAADIDLDYARLPYSVLLNSIEGSLNEGVEDIDITYGLAGAILALLACYDATGEYKSLELAKNAGVLLIGKLGKKFNKLAYSRRASLAPVLLGGMSHGTAGTGYALARLYGVTLNNKFRDAAIRCFSLEEELWDASQCNWADLRSTDSEEREPRAKFSNYWCNGAPGIVLALSEASLYIEDLPGVQHVALAAQSILEQGFDMRLSLCHGAAGNWLILKRVAQLQPDLLAGDRLTALAHRIVRESKGFTVADGRPGGLPCGLMSGLAGVGFALLSLASQETQPCLLSLSVESLRWG